MKWFGLSSIDLNLFGEVDKEREGNCMALKNFLMPNDDIDVGCAFGMKEGWDEETAHSTVFNFMRQEENKKFRQIYYLLKDFLAEQGKGSLVVTGFSFGWGDDFPMAMLTMSHEYMRVIFKQAEKDIWIIDEVEFGDVKDL